MVELFTQNVYEYKNTNINKKNIQIVYVKMSASKTSKTS